MTNIQLNLLISNLFLIAFLHQIGSEIGLFFFFTVWSFVLIGNVLISSVTGDEK